MKLSALQRDILLGLVLVFCVSFSVKSQKERLDGTDFRYNLYQQRLRLPEPEVLKLISLGYDNIYANWLWLQAIQAFGAGWITEDGTTRPIYQYFDTMTELDPQFIPSYRFANLIIGDNRKDWKLGQDIVRKGMYKNPRNYDLPYLGLYNAIWMYENENDARWFAHYLVRIPDAPAFMKRMEEYIERQAGRYNIAYEYNVRYFLEYQSRNNTIEREIALGRLNNIFDRQFREHISRAVYKYIEENGEHPERIEDVIVPKYMEPLETPTASGFLLAYLDNLATIETLSADRSIPEDLVDRITQSSYRRIDGLPPDERLVQVADHEFDLNQRWFYIRTIDRNFMAFNNLPVDPERNKTIAYVVSVRDFENEINIRSYEAQGFIMNFVRQNNRRPSQEDVAQFLGRDRIGGHYVYDPNDPLSPDYGTFYSTALRRIIENQEPRIGARGFGPFPLPLEPTMKDFPRDAAWATEKGYLFPDGTYMHLEPGESYIMDSLDTPDGALFGPQRP